MVAEVLIMRFGLNGASNYTVMKAAAIYFWKCQQWKWSKYCGMARKFYLERFANGSL
jgi:hypothetical protein